MVVTDASYLVKYITRFTGEFFFQNWFEENILFLEESFAALIGIIFVYEAFDKMIDIKQQRPVLLHTVNILPSNCTCTALNGTLYRTPKTTINVNLVFILKIKIFSFFF